MFSMASEITRKLRPDRDFALCLLQFHVCCPFAIDKLFVSGDFCLLLIAFANSLNPDQDRSTV